MPGARDRQQGIAERGRDPPLRAAGWYRPAAVCNVSLSSTAQRTASRGSATKSCSKAPTGGLSPTTGVRLLMLRRFGSMRKPGTMCSLSPKGVMSASA